MTRTRKPSIVESLPDWGHGLIAVVLASGVAVLGHLL